MEEYLEELAQAARDPVMRERQRQYFAQLAAEHPPRRRRKTRPWSVAERIRVAAMITHSHARKA
jgi:hypothetical protein